MDVISMQTLLLPVCFACVYSSIAPSINLQPFGASGSIVHVEEIEQFPDSVDFLRQYVSMSKPVIVRDAGHVAFATKHWTDDYLRVKMSNYSDGASGRVSDVSVMVEQQKKEARGSGNLVMGFDTFLKYYNNTDIYLVDTLPGGMQEEVAVPHSLQCPSLLPFLYAPNLWFSSGGTHSVAHIDEYENIMCVVRGVKVVTMVHPRHLYQLPILHDGSLPMDVDSVDLHLYPDLEGMQYHRAEIMAGDCLYIPYLWVHQVNSHGSNMAVSIWWEPDKVTEDDCQGHSQGHLTLDKVTWLDQEEGEGDNMFMSQGDFVSVGLLVILACV